VKTYGEVAPAVCEVQPVVPLHDVPYKIVLLAIDVPPFVPAAVQLIVIKLPVPPGVAVTPVGAVGVASGTAELEFPEAAL
jgi:hypothetical protein